MTSPATVPAPGVPEPDGTGIDPGQQVALQLLIAQMVREAVRQMMADAGRLGLQWALRPVTVAAAPGTDPMRVPGTYDGDDTTFPAPFQSLIGVPAPGARLMGMHVPPAGDYLIGLAGGPLQLIDTQVFSTVGTDTWTRPAYGRLLWARVQAGGGAGGGAAATAAGQAGVGGGGGGGAYAELWVPVADVDAAVTVTVGAGGTGVAGGTGNTGGESRFGALCTAGGGLGGVSRAASAVAFGIEGGAGGANGTGAAGTLLVRGTAGVGGWADGQLGLSGSGGASHLGGGAVCRRTTAAAQSVVGAAGRSFGGGGGGSVTSGGVAAAIGGGSGAQGVVLVHTFA